MSRRLSVTVPDAIADRIDDIAYYEHRSVSNMAAELLRRAVKEVLSRPEWQPLTPEQREKFLTGLSRTKA